MNLGFGASLGGVVLFELLKFKDLTFDHVFFEGVSFYEKAPLLEFVLTRVFLHQFLGQFAGMQAVVTAADKKVVPDGNKVIAKQANLNHFVGILNLLGLLRILL